MPFIEKWEGYRALPYQCTSSVWTVGYGHTADAQKYSYLSHFEAEELLKKDLEEFAVRLAPHIRVPVSESQFIALLSLAFNIGVNGLVNKCPKLMRALNSGDYETAADEFLDITNGGVPGLVNRRKAEAALMREYR